jgi:hypothetical protein
MKRLVVLALLFSLLPVSSSFSDEFDCIRNLKGGTVKWDMDWQRDRVDQDVTYRIVNITESQIQRNLREVAVELLAEGGAKVPKRVSRIRMDYAAEIFCKRGAPAVKEPSVLVRTPNEMKMQTAAVAFSPSELPFRALEAGRWRARRMPEGSQLRVCATRDGMFACTDNDFQAIRQADADGRVRHQFPFIRFVDGGWVRGQETDLPRIGEVLTCSAMGRKFSCLAEEKNAFSQQLEKISERKI